MGSSCHGHVDCDGRYSISGDFNEWERSVIISCAKEWNDFVGREVITLVPGGVSTACGINRINSPEEHAELLKKRPNIPFDDFTGVQIDRTGAMWIVPNPEKLRITVLHEMGHAIGLSPGNTHVRHGIMAAPVKTETFTQDDRDECSLRGVCSVGR